MAEIVRDLVYLRYSAGDFCLDRFFSTSAIRVRTFPLNLESQCVQRIGTLSRRINKLIFITCRC